MVAQAVTEQVLLARFIELGGRVLRPRQLVDLAQDASVATSAITGRGGGEPLPVVFNGQLRGLGGTRTSRSVSRCAV